MPAAAAMAKVVTRERPGWIAVAAALMLGMTRGLREARHLPLPFWAVR
ncbi:hypothetical protein HMPREF9946_03387 [Acetobacteraceae bacterium AT-5844]|nr:hypothetical protein HMPREF9946_03387 [Acetobacteraceae bacterium AT-5844]